MNKIIWTDKYINKKLKFNVFISWFACHPSSLRLNIELDFFYLAQKKHFTREILKFIFIKLWEF